MDGRHDPPIHFWGAQTGHNKKLRMKIKDDMPLLEEILGDWQAQIDKDFQGYKYHAPTLYMGDNEFANRIHQFCFPGWMASVVA
jgi:hypothetical protein